MKVEFQELGPFGLLERAFRANPKGKAVVGHVRHTSYEDLYDSALRLASHFRDIGLKKGDIVALDIPQEMQPAFLFALFHEGIVTTPYNQTLLEGKPILLDALITTSPKPVGFRQVLVGEDFFESVAKCGTGIEPVGFGTNETVRIELSSGTTGTPKAMAISSRLLELRLQLAHEVRMQNPRYLSLIGLGATIGVQTMLVQIGLKRPFLVAGDVEKNFLQAQNWPAEALLCSPANLGSLIKYCEERRLALPNVLEIHMAGSTLPSPLLVRAQSIFANAKFKVAYGATEATLATFGEIDPHDSSNVGRPVGDSEFQIVDENHHPVETGAKGRVRFRNSNMVHSYVGDQIGSGEIFRDGWFYPGDSGFIDDSGALHVLGRNNDTINASGVKLDPVEVETYCVLQLGLKDAAGFEYKDPSGLTRFGLAFVSDAVPDIAELHSSLEKEFGKGVPSRYVRVESVPKSEMGKVNRTFLSDMVQRTVL